MQTDRKKNVCDYVVSSSDNDSDGDSHKMKPKRSEKVSKTRSDEEKSTTDSTDIRDELLESFEEKTKRKSNEKDKSPKRHVRKRSRSRSRSKDDRNRDDYKRRDDRRRPYRRDDDDRGGHRSDKSKRYDNRERRDDFERRTDNRRNDDRGRRRLPHTDMDLARVNREAYANNAERNLQQTCAKLKQQVEKRKLLWQGNKEKKIANHWEAMLSTCTDDKQAEKLKKLIGLKDSQLATASSDGQAGSSSTDGTSAPNKAEQIRMKQEEIFRSLDQQYEVARVSTHTHRGMGLGFTSKMNEYMAHINAHSAAAATLDDP